MSSINLNRKQSELCIIGLIAFVLSVLAFVSEDIHIVRWSRLAISCMIVTFMIVRHSLYENKLYLIGFLIIVIADLCLIYYENFAICTLYLLLTLLGFGLFLWKVFRIINWREIQFSSIAILILVTGLNLYVLNYLLQSVKIFVDPILWNFYYLYGIFGIFYCVIAGVGYMQLDRTGNEHYIITSYGYLLSNAFLLVAVYSDLFWFYYLSRTFYLGVLLFLSHYVILKLMEKRHTTF